MESVWDTRPLSIHKTRGEWHPNAFASSSSSALSSRRRSSAAHVPPPGPPPSQPIPSLPTQFEAYDHYDGMPSSPVNPLDPTPYQNGSYSPPHPYTRPAASANLAAVAAFSRARNVNQEPTAQPSSSDDLSDNPPKSILRASARSPPATHEIIPDRLLLSPPDTRPSEPRPSSRKALTRALELAREAVKLDSTNDDPYGAVMAYGKSVALLSEVMQRVMRGEDSTESHRRKNGRRRSVVAQEEEVKRLKSIHDTYADRMNILSLIYSIPLPTTSSSPTTYASSVSASATSTQPSSPVSSSSPTSEISTRTSRTSSSASIRSDQSGNRITDTTRVDFSDTSSDGMLAIGTAMFTLDTSVSSGGLSPRTPVGHSVHPYAATPPPVLTLSNNVNNRMSVATVSSVATITPPRPQVGRPRASSSLPPAAPPPTSVLPPAPATAEPPTEPTVSQTIPIITRARGHSITHRRAGSAAKLAALQEEPSFEESQAPSDTLLPSSSVVNRSRSRSITRESHPLPPLPAGNLPDSAITPRNSSLSAESQSPKSPTTAFVQRARGISTVSTISEVAATATQVALINTSPALGTISQRRTKTSAPPSMVATPLSPTESVESSASIPSMSRLTASSLPASTASSLGMVGRSRAASQPGRRPSLVTHNTYPFPPNTAQMQSRKISIPSKLNPNVPPQITINTALLSPPLAAKALVPLVPPPPIPHANIPNAPSSPMPPVAPPDPLRKPYHMMSLLRQTMTSKTGGYITRRLHVPQEVWSQGGAKLTNIPEKIRVVEVLCTALDEIQNCSVEYFGAGNVSSGMSMGIGSIGKKEAEAWAAKLEEFSNICDGVVSNFGKKLQVGEGFVTKKSSGVTSWGGRLTRQFDKLTNGKNLDSPAHYVQGLSKLFNQAQILDEHTKAASSQPIAPLYASFPPDVRAALDIKLKRASEFFAKVVLTFVIRDTALLLDKYVKKCEKWLAE